MICRKTSGPLHQTFVSRAMTTLLAGVLAGGVAVSPLAAQTPAPTAKPETAANSTQAPAPPAATPGAKLAHVPRRDRSYYSLFWGVDSLTAKAVESGELIKFSYRVLDAEKAKTLNEKTKEPAMYDPAIRAKLIIPSLEKVGQLRQSSTPEAGKVYWMAFSNPGRVVKRGDRVNVVIGPFHADGLVVE